MTAGLMPCRPSMDCSREPSNFGKFTDELSRAFHEYLGTPTIIIAAFVVLGIGMAELEQSGIPAVNALRESLHAMVFGNVEATREILISSAQTLITITSITFTVLLLAVQQAASAMSTQIIDQFLRRPINQVLFGYFVGMSLYTLITLAVIGPEFNPVLSTALGFVFAGIALYFLAALVYITLTQMRSGIVIHAIHDETLNARLRMLPLLARTGRAPRLAGVADLHTVPVRSRGDGYISNIDLDLIERTLPAGADELEIVLKVRIGSYVAHDDLVAEIRSTRTPAAPNLVETVLRALKLSRARDLQLDAGHGVEQIMNIGWTSISSAQHSPAAGAQAIHALRDLLASWSTPEPLAQMPRGVRPLPVVYDDNIVILPLRSLESLAVAAVESRQHQSFGHVVQAIATMYGRLPLELRMMSEAMLLRILRGLEHELLTFELDEALKHAAERLEAAGGARIAECVRKCRMQERAEVARMAR
ncbi:DUF2254 domain-containing protein, partial [Oxalobacteraceae bacterium OM1]